MPDTRLLSCDELDFDEYSFLQRESYSALLHHSGVSDMFMNPSYYKWKYNTPYGKALIALVYDGGRMVSSNAMIPLEFSYSNVRVTCWQSCDTATAPHACGKGYFSHCLNQLKSVLKSDEVFYGFPNKNSIRGFEKIGWVRKGIVSTWLNPFSLLSTYNEEVQESAKLSDSFDRHGTNASTSSHQRYVAIARDSGYLEWRYFRNPCHKYTFLELIGDSTHYGFSVIRRAHVLHRDVLIIMELVASSDCVERTMLRHVSWYAQKERPSMVILLDNGLKTTNALGSGYCPVWNRLLPKQQHLMGYAMPGEKSQFVFTKPWHITTGDWDAF
jgi:hypothetical protein